MNIVVTGFAGLEGSRLIFENRICREKLLNRYSKSFFGVFENRQSSELRPDGLEQLFEQEKERGRAADAGDGGVLSALWRVLKACRLGGTYAQKEIPVLQQTIEICEMFALNPYRLYAPGCRVWVSEDTGLIFREAAPAGVPLRVIGFTCKGAAIRRTDAGTESSLRRPEGDELKRIPGIAYP